MTSQTRPSKTRLSYGLGSLCGTLTMAIKRLAFTVVSAHENDRSEFAELVDQDDSRDIFDELPEPTHLDHGDVKLGAGKLRFMD